MKQNTNMKTETVLIRAASICISIVLLVSTLATATRNDEPVSLAAVSQATLSFMGADDTHSDNVSSHATIDTAGELMLGSFSSIRLDTYSEIALAGVNFDEQTQAVQEAKILVQAGRVWLTNHVMGSQIRLADDQLVVTNQGGTLLFDKSVSEGENTTNTRITATSGASAIALLAPGTEDIFFETALAPGKTIVISPELVTTLLNASDKVSRALAWESEVERTELVADAFYKDNITRDAFRANQLVDRLQTTLDAYQPSLFDTVREMLTVLPAAKKRFWQKNIGTVLARAIENPNSIDWDRVTHDVLLYPEARDVLAAIVPYARFAVSDALPEATRKTLATLATLDDEISKAAGLDTLAPVHAAAQQLYFAAIDQDNVAQHLATYQMHIDAVDALTPIAAELLANQLAAIAKKYPNETAALSAYFDMPAVTDAVAANQIADYLSLARALTHAGRTNTAATVLSRLAQIAELNSYHFDADTLAVIATNGKELNAQIAYVQSLHGSAPFNADAYATWKDEQETAQTANTEVSKQTMNINTAKKRAPRVRPAQTEEN